MEMFEGTDPTLWVFVGLAVVAAFVAGAMVALMVLSAAQAWRWLRRQPSATPDERRQAVEQLVDSPSYGRHVAVDPEPTVPIAGSELPPRSGVVLADTSPLPGLLDEPLLLPKVPPQPGQRDQLLEGERLRVDPVARLDADAALETVRNPAPATAAAPEAEQDKDDTDDQPPSGGIVAATAVVPRYAWSGGAAWPPSQWVPPAGAMMRAGGHRVVDYLKAPIRIRTLTWPARELVTSLRTDLADWSAKWRAETSTAARSRGRHRPDVVRGAESRRRAA